ncbi:hypothetical protein HD806DRAFT_516159 [Xylariaceae sp. AK1471]|nr:hypothetical protein HD806DRAFT_516159 [Xylariaceae sp. AK1471]
MATAAAATKEDPLTRAIDNADENTLRNVLKSMCWASEACRKEAMERMLVSRKHELIELSDSSDDDHGQRQDKKRKRVEVEVAQISRYEKCATCKETYDVTLNNDEACRTHEGLLEIDPDVFPDDDDVAYDINSIDVHTDWRREEWPEGFIWQCCGEPCNGKPCVVQRHK